LVKRRKDYDTTTSNYVDGLSIKAGRAVVNDDQISEIAPKWLNKNIKGRQHDKIIHIFLTIIHRLRMNWKLKI